MPVEARLYDVLIFSRRDAICKRGARFFIAAHALNIMQLRYRPDLGGRSRMRHTSASGCIRAHWPRIGRAPNPRGRELWTLPGFIDSRRIRVFASRCK